MVARQVLLLVIWLPFVRAFNPSLID